MQYGMLFGVLAYELLVIGGIGLWLARQRTGKEHEEGEFALGGRSLPVPVLAVTLALTVLGAAHILGVFEMTWDLGAAAVWFSIAHVILLVLVCTTTGLWFRRLGLTTVPQVLKTFFGDGIELLVSCVMAGCIFGILTLEAQGLGIVISSMTGWSIQAAAIAGSVLGIFYVVLAGMKEVGWINLVNAIVLYIGIILATIFVAQKLPGGNYDKVAEHYKTVPAKVMLEKDAAAPEGKTVQTNAKGEQYFEADQKFMLSIFGTRGIMLTFALGVTIAVVFSQGISQMLLQPAMSAKSEGDIKKALWIAAPVNGLFGVFIVVLGLTAKYLVVTGGLPEDLGGKNAAPTMLIEFLPGWLSTILLASFLAAILSTFAMTSLAPATIFSMNIYKNLYHPDATDNEVTKVTRIAIIVLAVIAMIVAAYLPPILAAIKWLFSWLIPVFWIVVFGFFWKRSRGAALATLLTAWVANSLWSFSSLPATLGLPGDANAYVVLVVTLVVAIVANATMKGEVGYFRSEEYRSKVGSV